MAITDVNIPSYFLKKEKEQLHGYSPITTLPVYELFIKKTADGISKVSNVHKDIE